MVRRVSDEAQVEGRLTSSAAQVIHPDPHAELLKDGDTPPTNFRSAAAKLSRMLRLGGVAAPVEEEEEAAAAQERGRSYEPDENDLLLLGVCTPARCCLVLGPRVRHAAGGGGSRRTCVLLACASGRAVYTA